MADGAALAVYMGYVAAPRSDKVIGGMSSLSPGPTHNSRNDKSTVSGDVASSTHLSAYRCIAEKGKVGLKVQYYLLTFLAPTCGWSGIEVPLYPHLKQEWPREG